MRTKFSPHSEENFTTLAAAGLALEMACSKRALSRTASPINLYADVALIDMAVDIVKLRKVS